MLCFHAQVYSYSINLGCTAGLLSQALLLSGSYDNKGQ